LRVFQKSNEQNAIAKGFPGQTYGKVDHKKQPKIKKDHNINHSFLDVQIAARYA
jgi:hypothetical protein